MPFPARALALPLLLTPLLTSCGSDDGGSLVGQVNDTTRRICLVAADQLTEPLADRNGRCFDAGPADLAGVSVGDCVRLEYRDRGEARLPQVTEVSPSTDCPTPR